MGRGECRTDMRHRQTETGRAAHAQAELRNGSTSHRNLAASAWKREEKAYLAFEHGLVLGADPHVERQSGMSRGSNFSPRRYCSKMSARLALIGEPHRTT